MNRTLSKDRYIQKSFNYPFTINQKTSKKKPKLIQHCHQSKNITTQNKHKNAQFPLLQQYSNQGIYQNMQIPNSQKYLKIENARDVRINRARIIDWLLDVCRAFQLRWQTYWCAIQLLDFLIFKIQYVKVPNIHIVSVTCIFMAIKLHQTYPPSLQKIVERSVYNAFSIKDVISIQKQILLFSTNLGEKPRHLYTIYNTLFELYPKKSLKERTQILRRIIIIWMDPVMVFKYRNSNKENININIKVVQNQENDTISYENIVKMIVKEIEEREDIFYLEKVKKYYICLLEWICKYKIMNHVKKLR